MRPSKPPIISATAAHGTPADNIGQRPRVHAPHEHEATSAMSVSEPAQKAVTQMLSRGSGLTEIEAFIERQPLDEEHKAALWLWAWAKQALTSP